MDVLNSYFSVQQIQIVLLSSDLCPVSIFSCVVCSHSKRKVSAVRGKRKVTDVCECKEVLWKQRWGAALSLPFQRFPWKLDTPGVQVSHASITEQDTCLLQKPCLSAILTSNSLIYLQKMQGLRFSKSSIKQNKSISKRKPNPTHEGKKTNRRKLVYQLV